MNETVMVVQKLTPTSNWVSRKDAILRVFFLWLPKLEVCVDRGQARRGKIRVLARLALEFARLKKTLRLFCRLNISDQTTRQALIKEGKGKARKGRSGNSFQFQLFSFSFFLVCACHAG